MHPSYNYKLLAFVAAVTTLSCCCCRVLFAAPPNHIMLLACFCPAASIPFGLKGPLSVTASAAGDRLQLLLQAASATDHASDQPLAKGRYTSDILPLTLELVRESDILSGAGVLVRPYANPNRNLNSNPNANPNPCLTQPNPNPNQVP